MGTVKIDYSVETLISGATFYGCGLVWPGRYPWSSYPAAAVLFRRFSEAWIPLKISRFWGIPPAGGIWIFW